MKKRHIILPLFAVFMAALYGGITAYNSNNVESKLFTQNVEALTNDEADDYVWDEDLGYYVPVNPNPMYAPKF